jgi:hypothetical protein
MYYTFTRAGKDPRGRERIDVRASMVYNVPTEKGKLPFTIESGELVGKDGSGYALFNHRRGWFDFYTMHMIVQGKLRIDIGGMKTQIELKQEQSTNITTTIYNPLLPVPAEIESEEQPGETQEYCGRRFRQRRCQLFPRFGSGRRR